MDKEISCPIRMLHPTKKTRSVETQQVTTSKPTHFSNGVKRKNRGGRKGSEREQGHDEDEKREGRKWTRNKRKRKKRYLDGSGRGQGKDSGWGGVRGTGRERDQDQDKDPAGQDPQPGPSTPYPTIPQGRGRRKVLDDVDIALMLSDGYEDPEVEAAPFEDSPLEDLPLEDLNADGDGFTDEVDDLEVGQEGEGVEEDGVEEVGGEEDDDLEGRRAVGEVGHPNTRIPIRIRKVNSLFASLDPNNYDQMVMPETRKAYDAILVRKKRGQDEVKITWVNAKPPIPTGRKVRVMVIFLRLAF